MKKFRIFLLLISIGSIFMQSCVKNNDIIFTGSAVEFDAATWNSNAVGVLYPILTRQPAAGRASSSSFIADSIITRRSGKAQLRVNLVGAQRTTDTEVTYSVEANSTAVAGTHFTALPGKLNIPANSSFGYIDVLILNPGPTSGFVDLIIKLTGGSGVTVSQNYNTVGLRITQN